MPLPDPRRQTAARIQRTENYAKKIQRMFSQTVNDLLALPISKADVSNGNMFSFDAETDRVQRQVEQLLRRLQAAATLSIQKGVTLEWEEANKAADAILQSHFSKQVLASPYMKGWNARNHEAMQQFINRSDYGMNLSQRVWQSCRQLRDEMEVALTISIGEGEDAGTISRRVRQYLNDPDLMFRRFRYKDEKGRWQTKWKKRIKDPDNPGKYKFIDYDKDSYKDQWTGRGYYKSSAMNAMRVARTETNIAYRRADHARWQGLDFVLGQRVQLSKNHPCADICDTLAGDYPKDFVFDGWHPQCFCFVTPILVDESEMAKMSEAFLRGEDYTPKGEPITEYPQGFKDWVKDNAHRIEDAKLRGALPYFIANNSDVVNDIINEVIVNYAPITKKDIDFLIRSGVVFPDKDTAYKILPNHNRKYAQQFISQCISDSICHSIYDYAPQFYNRRPDLKSLMDEIAGLKGVDEILRVKKINQAKAICGEETLKRLEMYSNGFGNKIKLKRYVYNEDIAPSFTFIDKNGNSVTTPKKLFDLVILRDDTGMEFGYPIGTRTATLIMDPRNAYNITKTLPTKLRKNIKRINFIKEINPQDSYWIDKYGDDHISCATDGGHVTFWQPAFKINKSDYFYTLCHESAHAYDNRHGKLSSKLEWKKAVQLDIAQVKIGSPYPTKYAETNLVEDFAESVKEWVKDPVWFKEFYPNRYDYLIKKFNGLLND